MSTWTMLPGDWYSYRRITSPVGRSIHARRCMPSRTSSLDRGCRHAQAPADPHRSKLQLAAELADLSRYLVASARGACVRPADRSTRSSSPPARHRFHHIEAVARDTLISRATCAIGRPDSIRNTIGRRPRGVSRALPCESSLLVRAWDLDSSTLAEETARSRPASTRSRSLQLAHALVNRFVALAPCDFVRHRRSGAFTTARRG